MVSVEQWMGYAWEASKVSPCSKKQVGAVLVDEMREVVACTGYGGWLHKCEPCIRKTKMWTQDGCWSIHAEQRAILRALKDFDTPNFEDLTMYVTHGPCDQCMKHMVNVGIRKVVFDQPYKTEYDKWKPYIEVWNMDRRIV